MSGVRCPDGPSGSCWSWSPAAACWPRPGTCARKPVYNECKRPRSETAASSDSDWSSPGLCDETS